MLLKELHLDKDVLNKLSFSIINNSKYFFITKDTRIEYLLIPQNILIKKKNATIVFFVKNTKDSASLTSFVKIFLNFLKNLSKQYNKKIFLRGLGFRITLIEDFNKKFLRFKLGFSHTIDFDLPESKISLILKKKTLHLKSYDNLFLGNFSRKIKNFKKPNSYNSKGFWYKGEKITNKIFKKK